MNTFGDRLRATRLAAGLSQAELAGEGLSASYVSLLESGKRSPSSEVAHLLAERLGCSVSNLTYGEPSEREERISLELAFARLAVEHGESLEARRRLELLLRDDGLSQRIRDEINHQLGIACDRSGDLRSAIQIFLPLFERACKGETHLLVNVLGLSLCGCYQDAGDISRAIEVGEAALSAARAQGLGGTDEYFRLAATAMAAYMVRGDWAHARIWAEELLGEAESESRQAGQGALYWNLGTLAVREGDVPRALQMFDQALGRLSELDNTRDYARLRYTVAMAVLTSDPPQAARAMDLLQRCAEDVRDLCSRDEQVSWKNAMALALLHHGDVAGAEMYARNACDMSAVSRAVHAEALMSLGDIEKARGNQEQAFQRWRSAFETLSGTTSSRSMALRWRSLAERLASDDPQMAAAAFRKALDGAGVGDLTVVHRRQSTSLGEHSKVHVEKP